MEDVAREAGFATSSLYGYFSGKEELFVATLDRIAERLLDVFDDPLLQELPFAERISGILRRVCQLIEPNREFFVLLFGQAPFIEWSASATVEASDVSKQSYRRFIQRLADEIVRADPRRPTEADALDLAYVLSGAFQAWVFRWLHGDLPDGLQQSLSRLFVKLRVVLDVEAA